LAAVLNALPGSVGQLYFKTPSSGKGEVGIKGGRERGEESGKGAKEGKFSKIGANVLNSN